MKEISIISDFWLQIPPRSELVEPEYSSRRLAYDALTNCSPHDNNHPNNHLQL